MKRSALLAVAFCLSGCVSADPTPSQLAANASKCRSFGYKDGTKAYSDCQMQLASVTAMNNQAALDRRQAAFSAMAMTPSPQAQFSPVYTQPQQVVYQTPQPTLSQTVNSTMQAQRW